WRRASLETPATTHPLTGHSGASVILHTTGSHSFVRKTAASATASARLRAQARKQHKLWMMGVPVPKILRESEDEAGRAAFDMAYIPGQSLANAVIQAAALDSERIVKAVERLIWLFLLERGEAIAQSRFHDKIDEIVMRSRDRVCGPALAAIESCAGRLMERDWSGIPESPCHGDLSLENILLTAGKSIAFIDCDDPWISSFWLDFGKLFQDVHGHWCLRELSVAPHPSQLVNACQKLEQLRGPLQSLASGIDAALPARLPQLAALGLLRALPYSQDPAMVAFLCHRILRLLEE
ncbi:MAG TPA: phosphotransferase, partial [Rhizomicrobium sp.]